MERYDSYKDSGIYFLPKLPSNWEIRKGKYLFKEENRPVRSDDEIVTCFRDGQVTLRKNRRTEGFTNSLKEIGYQGVRRGDLVIHNMDAFAGAIGISDSDGKATPVYACCTPKSEEVSQYYYCYLLRYLARNGFILSLAKGIRERSTDFRFNDFKELYLPVPTRKEQDAIVAYLDSATSKIDEAIAQQQKMIDLLNERKQIIINNAVTKGLDPNVKMKPSGIDWIGEIPEHWRIVPIKRFVDVRDGTHDTPFYVSYSDNAFPLVTSKDFTNGQICMDDAKWISKTDYIEIDKRSHVDKYDLLTSMIGGNIGKSVIKMDEKPIAIKNVALFKTMGDIVLAKYLYYYMIGGLINTQVDINSRGGAQAFLGLNDMRNLVYFDIPSDERKAIVEYLDRRLTMINLSLHNANKQISLLQERKQIIINDVVTGKVKVV